VKELAKEVVVSGVTLMTTALHQVPGVVQTDAQLDQPQDTTTSQQVSPADRATRALHKLDHHQLEQSQHQLEHAYSEEALREAEERNRHPTKQGQPTRESETKRPRGGGIRG
jgi:hypothetical protein